MRSLLRGDKDIHRDAHDLQDQPPPCPLEAPRTAITVGYYSLMGIVSGALVFALGSWLLARRRTGGSARAFGVFAAAWGLQIILSNLIYLPGVGSHVALETARHFLLLILPGILLVYVALSAPDAERRRRTTECAVAFGVGAIGAIAFLARPDLVVHGEDALSGTGFPSNLGILSLAFAAGPLYFAMALALRAFTERLLIARSVLDSRQLTLVVAGFTVYMGYAVTFNASRFLGVLPMYVKTRGWAETIVHAIIFAASIGALAVVAARLGGATRALLPSSRALLRRAFWISEGFGVATGVLGALGADVIGAVGLARCVLVGCVGFAAARHRLFDSKASASALPRVFVGGAVGLALVILAGQAIAIVNEATVRTPGFAGASAALLTISLILPILPFRSRFVPAAWAHWEPMREPLAARLEIYRAAMVGVAQRGMDPEAGNPGLAALRAELGLDRDDHARVEATVGGSDLAFAPRSMAPGSDERSVVYGTRRVANDATDTSPVEALSRTDVSNARSADTRR